MLSLMQFVYVIPVVLAVILAGVFGGRNVIGRARTLLWSGIALVITAQLFSLFTPLILRATRPGWLLSIWSMASLVVSVTGIVLLIIAVGQAARTVTPPHSGPQDYRYPPGPTPGYPSAGYPGTGYPQSGYGPSTPGPGASPWSNSGQ